MPAPKKKGGEDPHLHDFFAGLAMMSLILFYKADKHIIKEYTRRAYDIADAMMEERAERGKGDNT